MSGDQSDLKRGTITKPKIERPRLHKVILVNDDYTPREFVVQLLKAEFRVPEAQAAVRRAQSRLRAAGENV